MTRGLAISIVLAAAIAGGCVMLFNRYTRVHAHTNIVSSGSPVLSGWRIDHLSGPVSACNWGPAAAPNGVCFELTNTGRR
jgi:hypothetical protein